MVWAKPQESRGPRKISGEKNFTTSKRKQVYVVKPTLSPSTVGNAVTLLLFVQHLVLESIWVSIKVCSNIGCRWNGFLSIPTIFSEVGCSVLVQESISSSDGLL
jgi:hypothetical protein